VVSYAAAHATSLERSDGRRAAIGHRLLSSPAADVARRLHVALPHPALKRLRLIDTPGFAGGDAPIESQIRRAVSRADVVVWCTPAMQAWKASEQATWLGLPERVRSRGILAITFADAIGSAGDARRLMARLTAEAGSFFHGIVMMPAARLSGRGADAQA
jgi:GTPase Era involved in 16S rRNA processing